ncbi:MAG: response regulator [Gammaproteobacteria bacterium]|nr:response regulator [Gammaproteobacteria bacterium]
MKVNSQHAVDELIANIKHHDLVKARLVLGHFSEIDPAQQRRILFELGRCEAVLAVPLMVLLLVKFDDIERQYPSLRENLLEKVASEPKVIYQYLKWVVPEQWFYIQLAGELKLQGTVPFLVDLLTSSGDSKVIKGVLTALGEIGDLSAVDAVGEFLFSAEMDVAYTAVENIRLFDCSSTRKYLASALGRDETMDLEIIDTLAACADELSISALSKAMQSSTATVRNYSKGKLTALGALAVPQLVTNLGSSDHDLQIHSLNVLELIGSEAALMPIRKLINSQPANANVRFAAFEALAALPMRKGDYVWSSGLTDRDSNVRVAAARAIETNFDSTLAVGVRNLVSRGGEEAEGIIRAILDCQARAIFLDLMQQGIAMALIEDYLIRVAHHEVRDYFLQVLLEGGFETLAEKILLSEAEDGKEEKPIVCAVDDSKMILKIYRSVLNELGYEPMLFHNPEEALVWMSEHRPQLLCTDLNMPEMTGIELARAVREHHTSSQMPIIMVTTQDDKSDNSEAEAAGVDLIISKPFNSKKLGEAFATVGF